MTPYGPVSVPGTSQQLGASLPNNTNVLGASLPGSTPNLLGGSIGSGSTPVNSMPGSTVPGSTPVNSNMSNPLTNGSTPGITSN